MIIETWKIRNKKGITLKKMEELTGISKSTLNAIENGKVMPRIDTLEQIAKGMGVKITDLFESKYK